ncbi:hypothetical protein [Mycobacteroides abscessus]|uniref:hypothetical protein n=1 Tax=Mycobacteroides abscessus TaxID=36809 RepID=UPI000C264D67|nr:hypothetical protein [Mycobacteroides abscessus]
MTAAQILRTQLQANLDLITEYRNAFAEHTHNQAAAEAAWRTFSTLMAARRSMRLWCAETGKFNGVGRLLASVPDVAAAVCIYTKNARTRLLVFDLDAGKHGAAAVDADFCRITGWLNECGARWVADLSASGGVHILVPLEASLTVEDVRPLMYALAARCPTLDKTPMLNTRTGAISVPGSRCREGGFRVLIGGRGESAAAFYDRNAPDVFAQLTALVMVDPAESGYIGVDLEAPTAAAALPGHLVRRDPLPEAILNFAVHGTMPKDKRWNSRSEARISVLVHAMWRGASLTEVRHRMSPGQPWQGMANAYAFKKRGARMVTRSDADKLLRRDWAAAHRWHQQRSRYLQTVTHKKQHSPPPPAPTAVRHWLAHAICWCDTRFRSSLVRWSVAAVLQALAVSITRTCPPEGGVLQVAVGGRSLSLAAGLLSESTVWAVLRLLRELEGAPIQLVEKGTGTAADTYALVTPDVVDPAPDASGRPAVDGVPTAWSVLGWQHRRVYEAATEQGLRTVTQIAAAARVSVSSAYDSISALCRAGLLRRGRGWVSVGDTTLDDIAARHGLERTLRARITLYRKARERWKKWLEERPIKAALAVVRYALTRAGHILINTVLTDSEYEDYLAAVIRDEPPPEDHGAKDRRNAPQIPDIAA